MGGGKRGDFGNTYGASLDALSNFLTALSLVPGVDTIADLLAIPVDLARGDFTSAGLDALGVLPFVGEIADTAKIAKVADKAADTAKVVTKTSSAKKIGKSATTLFSNTGHVSSRSISTNREFFYGKSATQIDNALKNQGYKTTIRKSKHDSSKAKIIVSTNSNKHRNIMQVQVSPGSTRHGNVPYVKISTNNAGKFKIVDAPKSQYKSDGKESAKIFFRRKQK